MEDNDCPDSGAKQDGRGCWALRYGTPPSEGDTNWTDGWPGPGSKKTSASGVLSGPG